MPGELRDRQREIAAIDDLIERAHGGVGGALAIVGSSGIGKTALLEHARLRAGGRGFTLLVGRGVEHERDLAFGVAHQAFEPQLGRRVRPLLLADVPRHEALAELRLVVAAEAQRRPLLLAIDDVDCADEASAQWLAFTGLRLAGMRVALVATARAGRLGPLEDIVSSVLAPGPLGQAAVQRSFERGSGRDPPAGLVRACGAAIRRQRLPPAEIPR